MAKARKKLTIDLRGVVYREGGWWITHCLELDIAAEGGSASESIKNCLDLCALQINVAMQEGDLESIFRPAPAEIWRRYYVGQRLAVRRSLPKPVSRFEARQLAFG